MARRLHYVGRKRGRRRLAIPSSRATLAIEIVAQGLLVEAWLRAAGRVLVRGPEPRAVRRHHLIDEQDAPRRIAAELEFRVGDDDPPRRGGIASEGVHLTAQTL